MRPGYSDPAFRIVRYYQRRVVRQHDAAGANANRRGAAGDMSDHDDVAALAMPGML